MYAKSSAPAFKVIMSTSKNCENTAADAPLKIDCPQGELPASLSDGIHRDLVIDLANGVISLDKYESEFDRRVSRLTVGELTTEELVSLLNNDSRSAREFGLTRLPEASTPEVLGKKGGRGCPVSLSPPTLRAEKARGLSGIPSRL